MWSACGRCVTRAHCRGVHARDGARGRERERGMIDCQHACRMFVLLFGLLRVPGPPGHRGEDAEPLGRALADDLEQQVDRIFLHVHRADQGDERALRRFHRAVLRYRALAARPAAAAAAAAAIAEAGPIQTNPTLELHLPSEHLDLPDVRTFELRLSPCSLGIIRPFQHGGRPGSCAPGRDVAPSSRYALSLYFPVFTCNFFRGRADCLPSWDGSRCVANPPPFY